MRRACNTGQGICSPPVHAIKSARLGGPVAFFGLLEGLAWPAAAIVIALLYRDDIKSLLPQLRKAGPTGVELDPVEQQRTSRAPVQQSGVIGSEHIATTPIAEEIEQNIRRDLQAVRDEEKVAVLTRVLARSRLETLFERLYYQIFGSQIAGLKVLNAYNSTNLEGARNFLENSTHEVAKLYEGYGFAGWIGFLRDRGLIRQEGETIHITDFGREFLDYIRVNALPEEKAL